MAMALSFYIRLSYTSSKKGKGESMSDWSDNLVRERQEKERQEHIANELRLSNRRRVEQNSEPQWQAVRERIYALAEELNASWGEKAVTVVNVTSHEVSISVGDRSVSVTFIPRDQELKVPFYGGGLQLKVNGSDKLMWAAATESNKWWSDDDVARRTVECAWRGRNL